MSQTTNTVHELDLDALVGRSVDEARALVTDAGGTLRTAAPGQPVTADYRPQRVTVLVDGDRIVGNLGVG